MKIQDILKGKMLEGSDDIRCGNCKHFSPRPGEKAGFCAIKVTSLYYDDWVCIHWEGKPESAA